MLLCSRAPPIPRFGWLISGDRALIGGNWIGLWPMATSPPPVAWRRTAEIGACKHTRLRITPTSQLREYLCRYFKPKRVHLLEEAQPVLRVMVACQVLAASPKIRNSRFTHSTESDYSQTPASNLITLWTHHQTACGSQVGNSPEPTAVHWTEENSGVLGESLSFLLDTRGFTLIYFLVTNGCTESHTHCGLNSCVPPVVCRCFWWSSLMFSDPDLFLLVFITLTQQFFSSSCSRRNKLHQLHF